MSKARTLANLISDNAELADGQISVAEVVGAAPLASPTFTGTASGTFSGPLTGNVTGNLTGNVTGAVTGDVTAPEIDLTAISSTISDTAVDIFVYDTSKDSDGGAWRKRTQGTSWYNETLNTSTRGSRKEFPSVAVIVGERDKVTIYDGDDPDLPMWMVCTTSSNSFWIRYNADNRSIYALNGTLMVGANGGATADSLLSRMEFLKDRVERHFDGNVHQVGLNTVSKRNQAFYTGYDGGQNIVSRYVNDVAMTVLPNAPIDAATGLPVPTIAVATDGGVSVIKDDGTVVDSSVTSVGFDNVGFIGNALYVARKSHMNFYVYSSFASDGFAHDYIANSNYTAGDAVAIMQQSATDIEATASSSDTIYIGADNGEGLKVALKEEDNTLDNVTYITSTYNTGWQNGDIKLATLSDTDDTDVTGSDLVGSATLYATARVSGQTYTAGSSTVGIDDDEATPDGYVALALGGLTSGKVYTVTMVADQAYSPSSTAYTNFVDVDNVGKTIDSSLQGTTTTQTVTFTAGTTNRVFFYSNYAGGTLTYTWTLRLAEADRSVNGNGLQVFGSITKSAGPSGRDLVGYSGFSSSNYFKQPYNSGLDFGTGDFAYSGWFYKSTTTSSTLLHRSAAQDGEANWNNAGQIHQMEFNGTSLVAAIYNTGFGNQANLSVTDDAYVTGRWVNFVFMRKGSSMEMWLDGELKDQATNTLSATNTSATLWIGNRPNISDRPFNGVLALFRASATAPSPEQIAKIYEDEKFLFQDGAQATLYGSSDAVTALAYDDSTELLHVGTSAGRSVFQGLRRVDNTTDAVGAAISASNGLVAED